MRHAIDENTLTGWFAGRLPDEWFTEAPTITTDREEILVVGSLAEPDYPKDADDTAEGAARAGPASNGSARTRGISA